MWNSLWSIDVLLLSDVKIPFSEKFHFLQRDIEEVQKAVSDGNTDPEDRMGPDEAPPISIFRLVCCSCPIPWSSGQLFSGQLGQLEEFPGWKLMVVAALGGSHYLVRTNIGETITIFAVVDYKVIGNVVTKFYWDMTYYWHNFGDTMPGGCCPSDDLARFDVTVSPRGSFVVIVGPTEHCGYDWTTGTRPTSRDIPTTKLLRCYSGKIEVGAIVIVWVLFYTTNLEIEDQV